MSGDWIAQLMALGEPCSAATPGMPTREAVLDVLSGLNARTRTEVATRRRLLDEQAALISGLLGLEAAAGDGDPSLLDGLRTLLGAQAPASVRKVSVRTRLLRLVGLPKKTLDNLTNRGEDRTDVAVRYTDMVAEHTKKKRDELRDSLGDVQITVGGQQVRDPLSLLLTLTTAAGAAALSVRGSEKSSNGKQLERAVLGAVLTLFGLSKATPDATGDGVFWLSHMEEGGREADATVLLPGGHAVKIDMGFIGEGNPEIVKDKLSRYAKLSEVGGARREVHTVVIADKLSDGSTTWNAAREVGSALVQMSDPNWVLDLRKALIGAGMDPQPSQLLAAALTAASDTTSRRQALAAHLPAVDVADTAA